MNNTIKFEIVTPEKVVLKDEILQITAPTKSGEITILPRHIPLVSSLLTGVIEIVKKNNQRDVMSVAGGFIEVLKEKVVVLADVAERAEDIDITKAEEARQRAEESLRSKRNIDREQFASINASLARELARTKAVRRWREIKNIDK